MPKRPKTHQIADLAISRVSEIFHEAGFVCETNKGDYGEDLIVQPVHWQTVDPFRIYVQVKAQGRKVTVRGRNSSFSRAFPRDHVRKWMRSPELVVVVFWLEKSNVAYFAVPENQYTEWHLLGSTKATVPIVVDFENVLTRESALHLAWGARIKNIDRMLLQVLSWLDFSPAPPKAMRSRLNREVFAIAAYFLEMLGLVEPLAAGVRLGPCFRHTFNDFVASIALKADKRRINRKALTIIGEPGELATALILFRLFQLAPGFGVPHLLLAHSMNLLKGLISLRLAEGKGDLLRAD